MQTTFCASNKAKHLKKSKKKKKNGKKKYIKEKTNFNLFY